MNTILAFATGYTIQQYEPFLKSLRKLTQSFRLVLFTDLQQSDFADWSFCDVQNINGGEYAHINQPVISAVIRYYYYHAYLKQHNVTGPILFSDVRDVVVQHDGVFNELNNNKIYVFKENNRYIFGEEDCHKNWFNCIGRSDFIDKHYNQTFYCSGVQLFGSSNIAILYLNLFINECARYIDYTFAINDQTIHNLLIYENIIDDEYLHRYETELNDKVFSMGLCREEDYTIKNNVLYLSATNVCPSIVHQYDRRLDRTKYLLT